MVKDTNDRVPTPTATEIAMRNAPSIGDVIAAKDAYIRRLEAENAELVALLQRAAEELRLIRMKDCDATYDITLRTELSDAIRKARENK